ncbi:MAG: MFS transporter [Promethearchaeota archaeon]
MSKETTDISGLDDWNEWHESKKSLFSFNIGSFGFELVGNVFSGLYFYFYEVELLLPGIFLMLANLIFALWNAVNDPVMGYIIEKPQKFWGKWGKRFPWLAIMLIPMYICYFFLFAPPQGMGAFGLFLWMCVMLCLADTFYSAFFIAWYGMFPEKFRTDKSKRKANVYKLVLSIISVIVGTLIPPEIYKYGDLGSFAAMAGVILLIGSIAGIVVIYGSREDPARKALEVAQGRVKQDPFFQSMKIGLKNKAFVAYILLYFGNAIWDLFVLGSVNYYGRWILGIPASDLVILYVAFILGQLISVPIFNFVLKKVGFYKNALLGGLIESIFTLFFLFARDANTAFIFIFVVGIGNGAMWVNQAPILTRCLDSLALDTGKRDSGVFIGVSRFFGRLGIILFTFLMVFIHDITGFNAMAPTGKGMQTPLADFGILMTICIIPVIGTAVFTILFALVFDIKGEKVKWLEEQLKAQGLK